MSLSFRSYRSSSAGNCLAIWTADSGILVDCGITTLRDCRALLRDHAAAHGPIAGLVVSHAHGDHLSGQALRVMGEEGVNVLAHPKVVSQLRGRHAAGTGGVSAIRPFEGDAVALGGFLISAIPLSHAPNVATYGFAITAGHGTGQRRIVVCTDFYDPRDVLPHLAGADFVFVEANHDVDLLRQHFNPNSRFHSNNGRTARLLAEASRRGAMTPRHVVLGHLSEERNRDQLALREVERAFAVQGLKIQFPLETAPKRQPSRVIRLA